LTTFGSSILSSKNTSEIIPSSFSKEKRHMLAETKGKKFSQSQKILRNETNNQPSGEKIILSRSQSQLKEHEKIKGEAENKSTKLTRSIPQIVLLNESNNFIPPSNPP
jgi:hypothetical protein